MIEHNGYDFSIWIYKHETGFELLWLGREQEIASKRYEAYKAESTLPIYLYTPDGKMLAGRTTIDDGFNWCN